MFFIENFEMISKGNRMALVLLYTIRLCDGMWVTTDLTTEEINDIFTSSRDQGCSNAELMYEWTEEGKGDICASVLNSDPIAAMNIKHLDKTDPSYAHLMSPQEMGSDLFDQHFSLVNAKTIEEQQDSDAELESDVLVPVYRLAPRTIVVGGKSQEIFAFPCLVMIDNKVEEIHIADGYLEKTYTLLIQARLLEEESEEETLLVMGFVEIPPDRPLAVDQETLEESYFVSLAALQVKIFLCWEEDESLINSILALSEKEKVKLCSLVNDSIHSDSGERIVGARFEIANFEHGPVTFTELKRDPPKLRPPYQNIKGVECHHENISFNLVPNWLRRNGVFVLTYSDSEAPIQMVVEVPNSPVHQRPETSRSLEKEEIKASTSRKRKSSNLRNRGNLPESSKQRKLSNVTTTEPKTTTKTITIAQKAVVSIFHVEGVSFLVNRENGIRITI